MSRRASIRESIEYNKRHWPAECPAGVAEGELYTFCSYAGNPGRYEEANQGEEERLRFIEKHMPGCAECSGVYDHVAGTVSRISEFLEKEFGKPPSKPN